MLPPSEFNGIIPEPLAIHSDGGLVFKGTFSTTRLYRAIIHSDSLQVSYNVGMLQKSFQTSLKSNKHCDKVTSIATENNTSTLLAIARAPFRVQRQL